MGMMVSYSHAVPYIRRLLCMGAYRGESAERLRDKRDGLAEARGLGRALEILRISNDGKRLMVPGIAEEDTLPPGAVDAARRLLGRDADALLGLENMEEA